MGASDRTSVDEERMERINRYVSEGEGEGRIDRLERLEDIFDLGAAELLGSGSLGEVVRAPEKSSQEVRALKLVSLNRLISTGLSEARLKREVSIMLQLKHPHIVRLVDVLGCSSQPKVCESEPPYLCIVMEYLPNAEPLSEVIRRGGPQPKLAWKVVAQLISALSCMHSRGIVHRDVWSENVLFTKTPNDEERAVLVDFGSAEYTDCEALGHFLNLPYMSPEAAGGEPQSPGDDVWQAGILLTEVVTGIFVTERLGCSDIPLCKDQGILTDALEHTAIEGGLQLGALARRLLSMDPRGRPSSQQVFRELARELSQGMQELFQDATAEASEQWRSAAADPDLTSCIIRMPERQLSTGTVIRTATVQTLTEQPKTPAMTEQFRAVRTPQRQSSAASPLVARARITPQVQAGPPTMKEVIRPEDFPQPSVYLTPEMARRELSASASAVVPAIRYPSVTRWQSASGSLMLPPQALQQGSTTISSDNTPSARVEVATLAEPVVQQRATSLSRMSSGVPQRDFRPSIVAGNMPENSATFGAEFLSASGDGLRPTLSKTLTSGSGAYLPGVGWTGAAQPGAPLTSHMVTGINSLRASSPSLFQRSAQASSPTRMISSPMQRPIAGNMQLRTSSPQSRLDRVTSAVRVVSPQSRIPQLQGSLAPVTQVGGTTAWADWAARWRASQRTFEAAPGQDQLVATNGFARRSPADNAGPRLADLTCLKQQLRSLHDDLAEVKTIFTDQEFDESHKVQTKESTSGHGGNAISTTGGGSQPLCSPVLSSTIGSAGAASGGGSQPSGRRMLMASPTQGTRGVALQTMTPAGVLTSPSPRTRQTLPTSQDFYVAASGIPQSPPMWRMSQCASPRRAQAQSDSSAGMLSNMPNGIKQPPLWPGMIGAAARSQVATGKTA